ncbi:sulfatase-like hydrolase/transferase [Persicitalea sp.]|uniref:sulfatase-like hydrolase/transferase n=1 Tax=Persicitalea sp. TaxID=3100273 RepID=UPI003593FB84
MNYSLFIIILISVLSQQVEPVAEKKPNIVFILVDDLGKEWISTYGAEDVTTPHIDALARSGTSFNNVYSMPQCTPTRLTLLTGQYPFRHGWVNHWDVPRWGGQAHFDETKHPSLGAEMKKAGYRTCVVGKWQIDDFRVEPDAMTRAGFDEYCMWTGWEEGNDPSQERYFDPYIFTKEGSKTYKGEFGPDIFSDFIVSFIKERKKELNAARPFFVYYPMVLTHTPFTDTPDEKADTPLGKHKAMVRYTDKIVGKLVTALTEAGLLENTIIVFTTDNGTTSAISGRYNGRLVKGGKAHTTENGICEPFIVSWKNHIEPDTKSEALIDFSDIFPTFLDLAGMKVGKTWRSDGATHIVDGRSFKQALLKSTDRSKRSWILGMGGGNNARLTEKGVENKYKFRDRVVRNERYKLYIDSNRKPEKFIDLREDPEEKINLLDSLTNGERKANFSKLMAVVKSFPEKDSDPKYRLNPVQPWDVEVTAESQVWKK